MAQYKTFYDAWVAQNSKPTPAQSTWTQPNASGSTGQQQLADAYSAKNPTWSPDPSYGVTVNPATFNPYADPSYAATSSAVENATQHAGAEYGYTDKDGVYHPGYQTHNIGQTTGYDRSGNLITEGADYNPYSEAAILKKNYDNTVRGTTNSYASQGQLYAGSLINAQGTNDWNYGVSSDQLKRSTQNAYHGNDQAFQGTSDQGMFTMAQAFGPAFTSFLAGQRGY